jgi:hypothetical protein
MRFHRVELDSVLSGKDGQPVFPRKEVPHER